MPAFSWPEFALFGGAALFGIACATPYVMELNRDAFKKAQERLRRPLWVLVALQNAQNFVLAAVAIGLGLLIAPDSGLGAPLVEALLTGKPLTTQVQRIIPPALILGVVCATLALLLEITLFWPRLPQAMRTFPIPALWKRFLACFYGGITEELLCRLFLFSWLAWLIGLAWSGPAGRPAAGAFWLANVLAAVIFGLAHLPATATQVRLTPLLIGRAILLNSLLGVAAGYLFWQYGLEAAMLAHFSADLVFHLIGDSLAKKSQAAQTSTQG
jgi:membrane protease YdiL (CAAX protease family)